MAKVKAPLFGFSASKKFDKIHTYRRSLGETIAQKYFKPTNPRSEKQQSIRYAFRDLLREWKNLTATQRDSWDNWVIAKRKRNWRGYDLFGSENFAQYHATGTFKKWADYDLIVISNAKDTAIALDGSAVVFRRTD